MTVTGGRVVVGGSRTLVAASSGWEHAFPLERSRSSSREPAHPIAAGLARDRRFSPTKKRPATRTVPLRPTRGARNCSYVALLLTFDVMASSKPVQPLGPAAVAAFTATVVVGWIAAWIISQRVFNTPAGIVITSVPFFFLLMAVEALLGRGRFSSAGEYDLSDSVSSIGAGAVQQLGIMMLPLGAKPLFRALQDRFAFFVLPADAWYTLPVAFIVYDLQYYLTHRCAALPRWGLPPSTCWAVGPALTPPCHQLPPRVQRGLVLPPGPPQLGPLQPELRAAAGEAATPPRTPPRPAPNHPNAPAPRRAWASTSLPSGPRPSTRSSCPSRPTSRPPPATPPTSSGSTASSSTACPASSSSCSAPPPTTACTTTAACTRCGPLLLPGAITPATHSPRAELRGHPHRVGPPLRHLPG